MVGSDFWSSHSRPFSFRHVALDTQTDQIKKADNKCRLISRDIERGRAPGLQAKLSPQMTRKQKQTIAALTILVLGVLASLPFVITAEYRRVTSPGGRFYAVASYPIWQHYIPMSPGGSGDKSGYVTVYTHEGKSCGRVPIDMVWMIQDMKWSATNAELPLVAEWDLAKQAVKPFR